jgi:hypothetical protein
MAVRPDPALKFRHIAPHWTEADSGCEGRQALVVAEAIRAATVASLRLIEGCRSGPARWCLFIKSLAIELEYARERRKGWPTVPIYQAQS